MYDFHYNYAKKYENNTILLLIDTGSFTYETETKNVHENMWKDH